jgi:hypothetical protein
MDDSGETILKLRSENAALRTEVQEWKEAARKEREYSLSVEKNRNTWSEYAAFLGKELGDLASFASIHHWKCSPGVFETGKKFRAELGIPEPGKVRGS